MKKNLLKMLLIGCMVVSSASTGVFASTDVNKSKENKVEQTQMLIDSLIDDANKAGKDIEDKIDALNNKIDEMQSEDNEIMEKVNKYEQSKLAENGDNYDDMVEYVNSLPNDMIEYIKSLPILTDSEKDKLIDTQKKLEPYYKQLDSLYEELNKVQKPILDKISKLYDKIDEEYGVNIG